MVVYVDCAAVTKTLLLDNNDRTDNPMQTYLVDSGMTTYSFDHVKLLNKVKLGFAPADVASQTVTVSGARRPRSTADQEDRLIALWAAWPELTCACLDRCCLLCL